MNTPDFDGWTALHLVVERNNRTIASILTKAGAGVDGVTPQGWASLHMLIDIREEDVSQALLQAGANADVLHKRGGSILHEAI